MTTFFVSDTHFGHKNINRLANRPFDSVEEMNEVVARRWNETVDINDTVYHLGDVALGKIDDSLSVISRLNGIKHMITGNHDRPFPPMYKFKQEKIDYWRQRYLDAGFVSIDEVGQIEIAGILFYMCHFPYNGDSHDEERFSDYRLPDKGVPLIHGHTHRNTPNPVSFTERGTMQIHVGVDQPEWDFAPVSEEQILGLIRSQAFINDARIRNL